MFLQWLTASLVLPLGIAQALVTFRDALPPTVRLDNATFVGVSNGTVSKFLGIPFAQPPYVQFLEVSVLWSLTGRFLISGLETFGFVCQYRWDTTMERSKRLLSASPALSRMLQESFLQIYPKLLLLLLLVSLLPSLPQVVKIVSVIFYCSGQIFDTCWEIGLTLNVIVPATATPQSKLPVAVVRCNV
jgi:hypothetical protein